jgi:hypothetical protein
MNTQEYRTIVSHFNNKVNGEFDEEEFVIEMNESNFKDAAELKHYLARSFRNRELPGQAQEEDLEWSNYPESAFENYSYFYGCALKEEHNY